jgi:hypothetical protein
MELLKIEQTRHKAGVILDPVNNLISFNGFSLPEDAMGFFLPIINWIYEYSNQCNDLAKKNISLKVEFKLSYFNSASYRAFLEIFHIFEKMVKQGLKISIDWYYEKLDNSMLDSGKELAEMANIPLNFIEIN